MAGWQEIYMPQMVNILQNLDESYPAKGQKLEVWISSLVKFWEDSKPIALASNEAIALEPQLSREWFRQIWTVSSQLPNWSARNAEDRADAELRLFMLGTFTEHVLMMWLGGSAPITREQVLKSLAEQWSREFS